ncbi:hypothetical protein, unlikely [Trypanosoma brucei brucei TREU927]|uniref:Uncharacterized protein n=1 Tax=Trypanosoma brucei brucei (strain 927/4 GUTat10.1) TaxID=185431 RepID=Q38DR6_TRYB2|nr:hypothetical protein, unlikely [Trypanosoma brucei brucei TREU927]EAN77054.1 hypothetical protein, unlikely [Trypanosoma brucei brucei TREU927]
MFIYIFIYLICTHTDTHTWKHPVVIPSLSRCKHLNSLHLLLPFIIITFFFEPLLLSIFSFILIYVSLSSSSVFSLLNVQMVFKRFSPSSLFLLLFYDSNHHILLKQKWGDFRQEG